MCSQRSAADATCVLATRDLTADGDSAMRPLRIVTTGLAVTYPFGGVFWDYLQYAQGLQQLGHEVLYLEDTGKWCYDPVSATFVEDGSRNATTFAKHVAGFAPGMVNRWFFRDAAEKTHGWSWDEVVQFLRGADLFLHISASCWMREEHRAAARVAFIDSDPLYTQAALLAGPTEEDARARLARWKECHDVFFTFGENVGRPDCGVPSVSIDWIPTRQPIVLRLFESSAVPVESRRPTFTTVASWEPTESGPVVDGIAYAGKSREFERFIELPRRSPLPIEVAMSGPAPADRLQGHGWRLRKGYEVSSDPGVYRDYLANSAGEWSVAKNAYVTSRSGWFSCRTACYLALGVPAVVQDTGFGRTIPTQAGLLKFSDLDEAVDALERIVREPARHARAARTVAAEYFNSDMVLTRLIERALS